MFAKVFPVTDTTAPAGEPVIAVEGLVKHFGDVVALDGIDLHVDHGTVFGLLGPNGAGKTTAVRILTTILSHDGGRARVLGIDVAKDPQAVRERDRPGRPVRRRRREPHRTGEPPARRPAHPPPRRPTYVQRATSCWSASA